MLATGTVLTLILLTTIVLDWVCHNGCEISVVFDGIFLEIFHRKEEYSILIDKCRSLVRGIIKTKRNNRT